MRYFFVFLFWLSFLAACGQNGSHLADSPAHQTYIVFKPNSFTNAFTLNADPVLRIRSGDTIKTETIDASGVDKNGTRRQRGGNPLTGPFYVENASEGDILAISFTKIALNRNTAFTTQGFVDRSLDKSLTKEMKRPKRINWKLDTIRHLAFPDTSYEHLASFAVPLKPFLGCVGVAPAAKNNEILSFFQGAFGGNLDFNELVQSSTLYLPVFHDGAFLYIGDGHALQGDGELAGNALETSMDVEFTVRLIKHPPRPLALPRIEDDRYIMATGFDKSLDEALKIATAGLLEWLQQDYQLSMAEASQVLSTGIEYRIAEIADPNVEVVAKIKKEILKGIK